MKQTLEFCQREIARSMTLLIIRRNGRYWQTTHLRCTLSTADACSARRALALFLNPFSEWPRMRAKRYLINSRDTCENGVEQGFSPALRLKINAGLQPL